jgi:hypothetical protein
MSTKHIVMLLMYRFLIGDGCYKVLEWRKDRGRRHIMKKGLAVGIILLCVGRMINKKLL